MSKEQETIADIVAEIRRLNPEKFLSTPWYCEQLPNKMRSYADRIEAAALARSTIPNAEQFAQQAEFARHGVVTATVYRVITPEGVCVAEFTDAVRACDYGDVLRASEAHDDTGKEI